MTTAESYKRALSFILAREGGWYDGSNPRDPNPTMKGVIQKTYDAYRAKHGLPRQSVRLISPGELDEIYHEEYWRLVGADQLTDPKLALVAFDCAVNQGVGAARELLKVTEDVSIYLHCREALYRYVALRWPAKRPNLNGWLNRLVECAAETGALYGRGRGGGGRASH